MEKEHVGISHRGFDGGEIQERCSLRYDFLLCFLLLPIVLEDPRVT